MTASFGVWTERLHSVPFINYQLLRLVACGGADSAKLSRALRGRRRRSDVTAVLSRLSREAEAAANFREAAAYQRGVEFFTSPTSPDRRKAYDRFRQLFDRAHSGQPWTRHRVPFDGTALPAYHVPARQEPRRGTVLVHGGFDSLIEEFAGIWVAIADAGFDVVAFEGPGQGEARLVLGLTSRHEWERPVAAVLDYFSLQRASLVGISMGGWWALRAAAFEPRIEHVVSWSPVYDWLAQLPSFARPILFGMLKLRPLMNPLIRLRMWLFPVLEHAVRHAMFIVDRDQPMDAVDWMLAMNAAALHSERVRQDVLLLVGEDDRFQPPVLADAQQAALISARSITRRDFTRADSAADHCQMGNLGLACSVLTDWLRANSKERRA